MSNGIHPMNPTGGTNNRSHHAGRLVSCRRRTVTAREGSRITRAKIHSKKVRKNATIATIDNATETIKENRKNHQYSDRDALPLKSMYFWKHVLIDSVKLTQSALSLLLPNSSGPRRWP